MRIECAADGCAEHLERDGAQMITLRIEAHRLGWGYAVKIDHDRMKPLDTCPAHNTKGETR